MSGDNGTGQGGDGEKELVSIAFQVAAYSIVMVLALVGNLLVILTYRNDQNELKKLVMSATICHMAIADLITTICGVPSMISLLLNDRRWLISGHFGEAMCKMYSYAVEVGFAVSALSIAVIAVERFLSVFFPFRKLITVRAAHITGAVVWVAACFFYAPKLYGNIVVQYGESLYCISIFTKIKPWREIEACFFVLLFLVTLVLYVAIVVKVTQKNSIPGRVITENSHVARNRTNRRVIRQGIGVITIHYLCWFPYLWIYVVCVVFRLEVKNVCTNIGIFHDFFIFFLGFSNAALNPLLYTATNGSFRKGCKTVLQNIFKSCGGRVSPASSVRNSKVGSNVQREQLKQGCEAASQATAQNAQHSANLSEKETHAFELRGEERVQEPSKEFPRVIVVVSTK